LLFGLEVYETRAVLRVARWPISKGILG
jgi:hypothetical protein